MRGIGIRSLLVGAALTLAPTVALGAGHIEASTAFLMAWGKGQWAELAAVAADKVTVTIGGQEAAIDVAGQKAEAVLVFPFKGLSTVRVGGEVKGVTVDEITVKLGAESRTGKGTLTIEDRGGKPVITKVAVE